MITIQIDNEYMGIRVEGHAGYDERGKDIVCAGVSALVRTWEACVEEFQKDGLLKSSKIDISDGKAYVFAEPMEIYRDGIEVAFMTIKKGLFTLQRSLPEYIQLVPVTD